MKKEKFKHRGLKIKKNGSLITFFIPEVVGKSRMYFTDIHFLKCLIFGSRDYLYASLWHHEKARMDARLRAKDLREQNLAVKTQEIQSR